jgi:uncharacterized protein YbjT (DUF2867 family)
MPAGKKLAVAGATGRVGHHVVEVLTERGYEVVPISRSHGVDVITREGLPEALSGVEVIVDAATGPSPEQQAATEFFTTEAKNLQEAGQRAGVQRMIVVSIINTDRLKGGYALAKVAHEQMMLAGPIRARVLRAAQFHEFVEQLVQWGRQGEVVRVPGMRTQLVAARTVAEALADLAVDPAAAPGPMLEVAGPREETWSRWPSCLSPETVTRCGSNRSAIRSTVTPTSPASCCLVRTRGSAVRRSRSGWIPDPRASLAGTSDNRLSDVGLRDVWRGARGGGRRLRDLRR